MEQSFPSTHALYPGTFDPATFGHVSVAKRAIRLFGGLTIAVSKINSKDPIFTFEQRFDIVSELFKDFPNVKVMGFSGLLVDCAKQIGATVVVRGLRNMTDFDYEYRMAATNNIVLPGLETVFLMSEPCYNYISSTLVKQIAREGGDISPFVPELVQRVVKEGKR